jgi:hypothetical protein
VAVYRPAQGLRSRSTLLKLVGPGGFEPPTS